ncbi:rho GTPase-activating protein 44 isoform X6 [Sphaerodactylus townsendi]|uniref:rho GTPase-activating protein 44 isoform X6 n=1 Tax=Sphaerodactylus townsendi TaxID=933632 RepID=UPI0020262040|nr:rho GTPase-activating protein 44 isoform X6 [Sphaerodactylus townsendi]
MKKQFNRMRQLANQTVGRAEKTEVLSEDLLQVEKRLELVKQVSHSTHKKLTACLQGQQGSDSDKRSKKLPLTSLAQCLMEGSAILGDDSLLGKMLKLSGEAEDKLAQELIHFELQVERDVIEPLFVLAEVEIPNIQKQRKHLAKLVLDMDSSKTRWQQSAKSSGLSSNLQSSGAKVDALREEMEEAANRVEICRDQLSADMYNFVAKEIDYANYFQTLIEVQAEYHRKSLALLQNVLPQIKAQQEAWIEKPSFGKPLEEHLTVSGREIAFPIEACVTMLLECGMQEEGLFRVAPSASKLKKLKAALDCCVVDVQEYSADPHAIAGALKSYLRELPEPLMTFELYEEWIQASNIQDQDKRIQALWNSLEKLPKASFNNLRYLIKFLAKLTEYQDANKMTPSNIAIVLGPNLLWPQTEGNITEMMATVSLQIVAIIEPLIQHADWFFPGDIEFNLTGNYGSPVHVNHNANYNSMPSPDMDHADRKHPDQTRRPLSVATDNMMLEFYKKDGTDGVSSSWLDSCYIYPSPEDEKPPPYPYYPSFHHFHSKIGPCTRPEPPLPLYRWSGYSQTLPPASVSSSSSSPSPQQLDINSNPKPYFLHLPKQSSLTEMHGPETNPSSIHVKTSLTLSKPDPPGTLYSPRMSVSPPWVSCTCARDRGAGLTSTVKTKELSPVSGQKGSPACGHLTACGTAQQPLGLTQQLSTEQSPHTLRKVSKKLAPIPAKVPYVQSGSMSDQSPGQPSPASLSPTPPSTPSPYGLSYPQGYSLGSGPLSPAAAPSLASPPSLTSTLSKSRPTPKPRQRPTLPPPQPPTSNASGSSPQSVEHTILDGISPGESMSTDLAHPDIPSIHVEVDATLHLDPLGQVQRHPVPGKINSEEDSESTAL